jgi:hypothetical protein
MRNKSKLPIPITILLLTLITAVSWILFGVIRIFTKEPKPVVPQEILLPLTPTLDRQVLQALQQRLQLTDEEIGETAIVITATPTPEATPVATPSGTPASEATPAAEATTGGTLP